MGYQRPLAALHFDNPILEGFEVKCRPVPIARYFELIDQWKADSPLTGREKDALGRVTFIEYVTEWNLEDHDGNPIPVSLEALESNDYAWTEAVIAGWLTTLRELPAPLDISSTSGPSLAAVPIPMEPLSESQAS